MGKVETACYDFTDDNLNLMKVVESSPGGLKTLWEKGKLLIMSNFPFSHSVFNRFMLKTHKNKGLFGKGLIS